MSGSGHDALTKRNAARYFVEHRQVGWVLLVAVLLLGAFGYARMPKRKDPFIKIRAAVAVCAWPGVSAEKVEDLVTRRIEEKVAQNADVERIESTSRTGVSVVTIVLRDSVPVDSIAKAFDDIDLKLKDIRDLPQGTLPIDFQKDFGDTSALMLTVASPKARPVEVTLRAREMAKSLVASRLGATMGGHRRAMFLAYPASLNPEPLRRAVQTFTAFASASGRVRDLRSFEGPGFLALDGDVDTAEVWGALTQKFLDDQVSSQFHPEIWKRVVVDEPAQIEAALTAVAGDAFSYRELDEYTDRIVRQLRGLSTVAKVSRAGVVGERIFLDYSQERFAALGINQTTMRDAIVARNVVSSAGVLDAHGRRLAIDSSGQYKSDKDIGDTLLTTTPTGSPVYVRDVVDIARDYESPPLYVNYLTSKDDQGAFHRTRAITLAVQMRSGEQIATFADQVDAALSDVAQTMPEDLVIARTSDQAKQVEDKVGLFLTSLYEAIFIIVLVGLVGFREWRSALVLALSIPLTLAMTFVFMAILGIDIQQMSLAALILSLGLLVDDPVVAGDAIKHELDQGRPRKIAAWLGPTQLATAILFATITNIVAYLPFLLMRGDVGHFIYSLPVVLACSLVASRLVSLTFIPLLGYTFLRADERPAKDVKKGFMGVYRRVVSWAIRRRYRVLLASLVVLVGGGIAGSKLRSSFFPQDYSHLFYVDVFLPEDASIRATNEAALQSEGIVREVALAYGTQHSEKGKPRQVLHSIASFIGGGAPRFWYSLAPQQRQLNYAQLVVEVEDEHDTALLIAPLQEALTSQVPGARIDVRQLENGKPVPRPVEIRFAGDDVVTLRALAERAKAALREVDIATRVRDDWGENSFRVTVDVDTARAGLARVSNADVANASSGGFSGLPMNVLREGDKSIPIVARLRYEERGNAGDIQDLYVLASRGTQKVPLGQVAHVAYKYDLEKIQRRNQRRTISVSCFPSAGMLPLEVMKVARPRLTEISENLPPGYSMEIGGTEENVKKVRQDSVLVAIVSLAGILLTLVIQFKHAIKPLLVFAAIPYGVAGALIAIVVMGSPFGFTAILGVISLIGVIVSHVIVLFDTIEELREEGVPLERALLDAGTARVRPVLITVGATVLGLVPLALHGGPLWEPLCYAQIGGLTLATALTLLLVPVLYAVFVLDLKWLTWAVTPTGGGTLVMARKHAAPAVAPLPVPISIVPRPASDGAPAPMRRPAAGSLSRPSAPLYNADRTVVLPRQHATPSVEGHHPTNREYDDNAETEVRPPSILPSSSTRDRRSK